MMLSPEEEIDTFHHINSKSKHTMFRAFVYLGKGYLSKTDLRRTNYMQLGKLCWL